MRDGMVNTGGGLLSTRQQYSLLFTGVHRHFDKQCSQHRSKIFPRKVICEIITKI